jgi:hypothetical protein
MAGPSAHPVATAVEREARDQHPVDGGRGNLKATRVRLGDAKTAGDEVVVEVGHLEEAEPPGLSVDRREDQTFARFQGKP